MLERRAYAREDDSFTHAVPTPNLGASKRCARRPKIYFCCTMAKMATDPSVDAEAIMDSYPRAGAPWSPAEDARLVCLMREAMRCTVTTPFSYGRSSPARSVADALGRTMAAVQTRWQQIRQCEERAKCKTPKWPDCLPPMLWETATLTNNTMATIEVRGPRLGTIQLVPGESITRPVPYMQQVRVTKTTELGSTSISVKA